MYYEKKASLVGKTVYFAPSILKIKKSDRKMLTRKHAPVDDTVGEERLLVGTPCRVTAQTPNAALIFVTWQNNSGVTFKGRLPLRFFSDAPPSNNEFTKAKTHATIDDSKKPYREKKSRRFLILKQCDADNKMRPGTTVRYVGHDWVHGNTSINHGAFGVIEGRTPGHPNRFAVRYPNNDESVHCLAERLREVKHYLR